MPLLPPLPEPVPFEEVVVVLDRAAASARGGPLRAIPAAGRHLAVALDAAGFQIVRAPRPGAKLTL